jgi:hypothetical protein
MYENKYSNGLRNMSKANAILNNEIEQIDKNIFVLKIFYLHFKWLIKKISTLLGFEYLLSIIYSYIITYLDRKHASDIE